MRTLLGFSPAGWWRLLHRRVLAAAVEGGDGVAGDAGFAREGLGDAGGDGRPGETGRPELVGQLTDPGRVDAPRRRHRAVAGLEERPGAAAAPTVVETLGPKPAGGASEALWCDAAAPVSQHEAAFGDAGGRWGDRASVGLGDGAYASSHQALREAVERLDRSLGRGPEIEPSHRSLGLSL